jgi:RNA polymerase sigma-70 factor (ECF subfamily)
MATSMMERSSLVEGARMGDGTCWATLYRQAYPRLVRYAHHRLGNVDEAKDAASETMARAVASMDRFTSDDEGFTPWLFGICRNVVADALRARYRHLEHDRDVEASSLRSLAPEPDDGLIADEEARQVRAAFERLDADERELLELRVVAGLSAEEVAQVIGKKPGAVRMAQMRALGRLRSFVAEASCA